MELRLNCYMMLTKAIEDKQIRELIDQSEDILKKGAPKGEGAVIEDWKIEENKLGLTISSGRYVRPHDALLRLKNFFVKELGKKLRVGVRNIVATNYEITIDLETKPERRITLPFTKKIEVRDKKCRIILEDLDEEFLRRGYIDRLISLVNEKVSYEKYKRIEHHEILYEGKKTGLYYDRDPSEELLRRNWIRRTPHRNQFVLGPQITELSEAIKRAMVDMVYKPLGFVEMMFPKIVPWEIWKKSGHMSALYSGGFNPYFFSTPKTADPDAWEEITDIIKVTGEIPEDKLVDMLEAPRGGLAFAQCPPYWSYLEGETISDKDLPIKVFDWSGPTYRYEAGGAHGFERVDELHRIETLWVGTKEQVIELTNRVREKLRVLMEDALELQMREAWVTPWFIEQSGNKEIKEEKIVGTVDLEAYLPYNNIWLEVQNCSNNGDKYPQAFSVKSQKEALWSGCAGGSFERYLSAFLAQKGFDEKNWPKKFRKYVGELPPEITFL